MPCLAHLPIQVRDAAVALCGPIELADLAHTEALGKLLPDGRAQPIAHRQAYTVLSLHLTHWLLQKVAADLPDVLDYLAERKRGWVVTTARGEPDTPGQPPTLGTGRKRPLRLMTVGKQFSPRKRPGMRLLCRVDASGSPLLCSPHQRSSVVPLSPCRLLGTPSMLHTGQEGKPQH